MNCFYIVFSPPPSLNHHCPSSFLSWSMFPYPRVVLLVCADFPPPFFFEGVRVVAAAAIVVLVVEILVRLILIV